MAAGLLSLTALRRISGIACLAALALGTGGTAAQYIDTREAKPLAGVLKRIKDTGVVRVGFRQAAIPFSFEGPGGLPYGYSIDLCHEIVDDLARTVGAATLRIEYRRVTPSDRVRQVVDGQIDLECGATTRNAERRRQVEFSPLIFVAGTRLMVRRGSPVRSVRDLAGGQVAVVRGTTNADAMHRLAGRREHRFAVFVADDYEQALRKLASGEVDALAADDILLTGHIEQNGLRGQYAVVGELLSYEPYAIAFARDDPPLAEVVDASFRRLAGSREIRWIYDKWFLRPLPSGVRFGLPMSPQLERSFQLLGLPVD
jgi:glutamate/aspartate transport system substrate-binding protein